MGCAGRVQGSRGVGGPEPLCPSNLLVLRARHSHAVILDPWAASEQPENVVADLLSPKL